LVIGVPIPLDGAGTGRVDRESHLRVHPDVYNVVTVIKRRARQRKPLIGESGRLIDATEEDVSDPWVNELEYLPQTTTPAFPATTFRMDFSCRFP
jgi:hypothetical protein